MYTYILRVIIYMDLKGGNFMKRVSSSRSRGASGRGIRGIRSVSGRGHNVSGNFTRSTRLMGRLFLRNVYSRPRKYDDHNYKDYVGNSWIFQLIGTLIAIGFIALGFVVISIAF